jgi:hypothetical protein
MVENCQHHPNREQKSWFGMSVVLAFAHVMAAKGNLQF